MRFLHEEDVETSYLFFTIEVREHYLPYFTIAPRYQGDRNWDFFFFFG